MAADLQIADHPSPNFGARRDGLKPHLIVLHYTAMTDAPAALQRLCDPATEVSAHYLICKSGQITRMVDEANRAWHAGAGEWHGQSDINSRSVGIELDNDGQAPFTAPLMTAMEGLLKYIMARWAIPPTGVIGHSDMAPGRKWDPGPKFDWARLERQALAERSCMGKGSVDPASFRDLARAAGYTADAPLEDLLAAVRLRYRPYAKGPLNAYDFTALGSAAV